MLCCPPPPPVEPGPSSPARPPLSPQPAASVPLEVPHEAPTGRSGHGGLRVIDHSYTIRGDTERPETAATAGSDRDNGSAGDRGDRGLYHRGGRGGRPRTAPTPAPAAGRSRAVPTARGEEAEPDVAESPASTTAARGRGAVPRAGGCTNGCGGRGWNVPLTSRSVTFTDHLVPPLPWAGPPGGTIPSGLAPATEQNKRGGKHFY